MTLRSLPLLKALSSVSLSTSAACVRIEKFDDKLVATGKIADVPFSKTIELKRGFGLAAATTLPVLVQQVLSNIGEKTPANEDQVVVAVAADVDNEVMSTTFNIPLRASGLMQFEAFINKLQEVVNRVRGG